MKQQSDSSKRLNPNEIRISNWIGIYNDGSLIKAVSITDDEPLFSDDEPEEIAWQLEQWLSKVIYISEKNKIEDIY